MEATIIESPFDKIQRGLAAQRGEARGSVALNRQAWQEQWDEWFKKYYEAVKAEDYGGVEDAAYQLKMLKQQSFATV